jgi:hypothetical protein
MEGSTMGAFKLPVSSQQERPYTGRLIESLLEMVEKTEKKFHPTDDDIMLERESRVGPLTIDEVIGESRRRTGSR